MEKMKVLFCGGCDKETKHFIRGKCLECSICGDVK